MARAKYPGRDRVISRESARDRLFRQKFGPPQKWPCSRPREIHAIGLPSGVVPDGIGPLPVSMLARCRRCDNCLQHRRNLWTARARDEIRGSNRTWFGTLTVNPEHRMRLLVLAVRSTMERRLEAWTDLNTSEQFRAICRHLSRDVTLWLKRVRKLSGVPLRYLLVVEAHKDGFPHLHILLHEPTSAPVRKAMLESQWRSGFSHWRLVDAGDERAALYVCKYLSKDALTRIRASSRYGQGATATKISAAVEALAGAVATLNEASESEQ